MLVKLPRGRDPQRSLLKGTLAGGMLHHSSKLTPNPPGKQNFPRMYSRPFVRYLLIPQDAGFAGLPAPQAALWDARPSLAPLQEGAGREGGCSVAPGVSSSSVPPIWALEQNLCISPPISKHRCRKGSCAPAVTHQQSSPLPKTP